MFGKPNDTSTLLTVPHTHTYYEANISSKFIVKKYMLRSSRIPSEHQCTVIMDKKNCFLH
jgi:hypothetical protein